MPDQHGRERRKFPFRIVPWFFFLLVPCLVMIFRGNWNDTIPLYFIRLIIIVLLFLGIISMLLLARFKEDCFVDGNHNLLEEYPEVNIESLLVNYSHQIAVFVFGAASLGYNSLALYDSLYCVQYFKNGTFSSGDDSNQYNYKSEVIRVLQHFSETIFLIISIPYLVKFIHIHERRYKQHRVYVCILFAISANFTLWLYNYFRETGIGNILPHEDNVDIDYTSFQSACLKHRTAVYKYTSGEMEHLFYPCFMELAIASIEILSHMWFATFSGPDEEDLIEEEMHRSVPSQTFLTSSKHDFNSVHPLSLTNGEDTDSDQQPLPRTYSEKKAGCSVYKMPDHSIELHDGTGSVVSINMHSSDISKTLILPAEKVEEKAQLKKDKESHIPLSSENAEFKDANADTYQREVTKLKEVHKPEDNISSTMMESETGKLSYGNDQPSSSISDSSPQGADNGEKTPPKKEHEVNGQNKVSTSIGENGKQAEDPGITTLVDGNIQRRKHSVSDQEDTPCDGKSPADYMNSMQNLEDASTSGTQITLTTPEAVTRHPIACICWNNLRKYSVVIGNLVQRIWGNLLTRINLYTAFTIAIFEASLIQFFNINFKAADKKLNSSANPDDTTGTYHYLTTDELQRWIELPLVIFRLLIMVSPWLVITVQCWYILNLCRVRRNLLENMNSIYIILILCGFGGVVYLSFEIIVSGMSIYYFYNPNPNDLLVIKPSNPDNNSSADIAVILDVLTICESIMCLPRDWFQIGIIHLAYNYKISEHHKYHTDKKVFLTTLVNLVDFCAMLNFAEWGIGSFLETDFATERTELHKDVKEQWVAVYHVCMPLMLYFKYICTFHLLRVKHFIIHDLNALQNQTDVPVTEDENNIDSSRDKRTHNCKSAIAKKKPGQQHSVESEIETTESETDSSDTELLLQRPKKGANIKNRKT